MTLNALTTPAHLEDVLARTQGISAIPDFDVEKDPRTGAIQETADEPRDTLFKVRYEGSWHLIAEAPEDASDQTA